MNGPRLVLGWTEADKQRLFQKLKSETAVNIPDLKRHLKGAVGEKKNEPKAEADKLQGKAMAYKEPEPWREPVNGEALLSEVGDLIKMYVHTERRTH